MRIWPFLTVVAMVVVTIALGGCSAGYAGAANDDFDVGSFIRNPYPRHRHPGAYADPYGPTVPRLTYSLPSNPPPPNAFGWLRPYDHIPYQAQQEVRQTKGCTPDSLFARAGNGIFCAYPENAWFAECVNDQWLAARQRDRHVWVVHQLVRDNHNQPWLETYAEDQPEAHRCRIQLNRPHHRA